MTIMSTSPMINDVQMAIKEMSVNPHATKQ